MKAQAVAALAKKWADCKRCGLHKTRKHLVFGEGNVDADILIIGEGPGANEDDTGKPFQGDAGRILNDLLTSASLDRDNDCYITNIVCCRPTAKNIDERTEKETVENRVPSKIEREQCWPRLWQLIYMIDPMLIVTVGKVPLQALTSKAAKMGKIRGRVQTMVLHGRHTQLRYPVMPIYHTAYLARIHDHRPEGPWGQTANDLIEICNIIDHLRKVYYGIDVPDRWGREKRVKGKGKA